MKKPIVAFIILAIVVAGAGALFLLNSSYQKKAPEMRLPNEDINAKPEAENTVTIQDYSFSPNVITVKVGETVTWFNGDGVVHTVKSTDFTSPNIKNQESFKFQFTKVGTYEYSCGVHPYMKGKVVVE